MLSISRFGLVDKTAVAPGTENIFGWILLKTVLYQLIQLSSWIKHLSTARSTGSMCCLHLHLRECELSRPFLGSQADPQLLLDVLSVPPAAPSPPVTVAASPRVSLTSSPHRPMDAELHPTCNAHFHLQTCHSDVANLGFLRKLKVLALFCRAFPSPSPSSSFATRINKRRAWK